MVFSQDHPFPGVGKLIGCTLVLSGECHRPLARGLHHVLIKERLVRSNLLEPPRVREAVRFRVLREALDARIRALARELASQYAITDHIDYARFSVDPGTINLWPAR